MSEAVSEAVAEETAQEQATAAPRPERTPVLDWVSVGVAAVIVVAAITGLLPEVGW
ncbi:hypothetical protein IMZ11_09955 [Microtetraspora sp. AC03309]|uniref:hypothetical protein n=1 Tax=Microtetraspora sp. AC03309 TaxID=2779376 RepID=UPI001E55A9B9|nr:hypothetical protein [Microtetraspora sp. AC03309]MCC5575961.1 hypothetical protein [Microtetraspora sp. AC03309]